MKLHNPSLQEIEGKYFVNYYLEEMPKEKSDDDYDRIDYEIEKRWINSKQTRPVADDQVEEFKKLAYSTSTNWLKSELSFRKTLEQGINLPDDSVEIGCGLHQVYQCSSRLCHKDVNYAFLKQEAKPEIKFVNPDLQKRFEEIPQDFKDKTNAIDEGTEILPSVITTINDYHKCGACDRVVKDIRSDEGTGCFEVVDNQDEIWKEIFTDLDKWSRTMKSSFDTPIKIKELTDKYLITKKHG